MSSVVISGDTSGAITLAAPTVAGTNTITLPAVTGTMALTAGQIGMKNRFINGAMVIDQRNAGASVTNAVSTSQYCLDRWNMSSSVASKYTVQQNAGSVTPPVGFNNYLGVTSLSAYAVASTDYFRISQSIEGFNFADLGFGTANAKTVTASFWVRSSLTGTFGGHLINGTGTRIYPFTYTISSANTWEQKSVTIAGDTTGTWSIDNSTGALLGFSLGYGSSLSGTANAWNAGTASMPTGATSVVGTSGATWYITGVQLELGSAATTFDFRDYGRELILCQRYYETSGSATIVCGFSRSDGVILVPVYFAVDKRTTPTVTFSTILTATYIGTRGCAGNATYGASSAYSASFIATSEL